MRNLLITIFHLFLYIYQSLKLRNPSTSDGLTAYTAYYEIGYVFQ